MTFTFNRETYANLLHEVLPQPIETEVEYQRVLTIVELLINKEATSLEEDRLLDLFVILIEKFESKHYPLQKLSTPHSRLLHLMEANQLQPTDLIGIFGSSNLVAEVIDGEKLILQRRGFCAGRRFANANDKTHAQKLSDRFNLPSALFLI